MHMPVEGTFPKAGRRILFVDEVVIDGRSVNTTQS